MGGLKNLKVRCERMRRPGMQMRRLMYAWRPHGRGEVNGRHVDAEKGVAMSSCDAPPCFRCVTFGKSKNAVAEVTVASRYAASFSQSSRR